MYPWEAFSPPDPRANPYHYDDSGAYLGPPVEEADDPYRPGLIGSSGYDTSGAPPQPSYDPLSSAPKVAPAPAAQPLRAPATAPMQPATYQTDAFTSGGNYTTQPAPATAPATAPTTSAPAPAAPAAEPATGPASAPLAIEFDGGQGDVLPA
jgi:hypothetical protein